MKGVGEVISTIIIMSAILVSSILIFYTSLYIMSHSINAAEYGYMKSSLINIAVNTPLIIEGNTFIITVPKGSVGVGYFVNDRIYEVDVLTDSGWERITVDDKPTSIQVTSYKIVVPSKIVYGSSNFTVNDISYLPIVAEYYDNGASIINYNLTRFFINSYLVQSENGTEVYIRAVYVQLRVSYISGPHKVVFMPASKVLEKEFRNVQNIVFKEIDSRSGTVLREYSPSEIFALGYKVNLLLIVERINVVMT